MRLFLVLLLSIAQVVSCFGSVNDYLKIDCSHIKPKIDYVDAAFLIKLQAYENLDALKDGFNKYDIPLTEYNEFDVLSTNVLRSFCSSLISPYLLTQILSHLSIYQYCLNNNIKTALVVESHAQVVNDPQKIRKIISTLDISGQPWDIIYTDVDFHNPKTGELNVPLVKTIPQNKQTFDLNFSKILCRYGTTSFVISSSGMKKILDYFSSYWPNLPYDQVLFKIPNLNIYGSNIDIITNKYSIKCDDEETSAVSAHVHSFCETDSEFWLDPIDLVTHDRFDVMAKYIYAKYFLNQYETNWHIDLYKNHLKNWIKFYNTEPLKIGFQDFTSSFDTLLLSIQKHKFKGSSPVPINNLGLACDGSHRTGTCLALNIPVKVKVVSGNSSPGMTAGVFRDHFHLEEKYLDHMAFEYAKLKKNTFIACLFPIAHGFQEKTERILKKYGNIVHHKDIELTKSGTLEFIRAVNIGQCGKESHFDDFKQSGAKAKLCFPPKQNNNYLVRVYLYECNSKKDVIEAKKEIREYCNKGDEAIYINDTHAQTKIIAATLFNRNSIDFINKKKLNVYEKFDFLINKLKNFIDENELDSESLCVDTGSVLAVYGLRDCNDMDIIHRGPLPSSFKNYEIDSHNPHLHHHSVGLDEILYNPECHFYYEGIKFVAVDLVKKMKMDRGSEKDFRDIKLIDSLDP